MMDFLHNDTFLKCAAAACGLAAVGVQYLPQHTIGWKICAGILTVGTALGVYSSTGRAPKADPAPPAGP